MLMIHCPVCARGIPSDEWERFKMLERKWDHNHDCLVPAAHIPVHPFQNCCGSGHVPQVVTMRAYEVYAYVYGPQEALITGNCRGGFSVGELFAFLYARSFPKEEWRARFEEGIIGLKVRTK